MKNMLLRITGLILINCQIAYAWPGTTNHPDYSAFEITSDGAGLITIAMDQQEFPQQSEIITITQMEPGKHVLEIFSERIIDHGYYASRERIKIYAGTIFIRPASFTQAVIDQYGRFSVRDVDPLDLCNKPPQPAYDPYQQFNPYTPFQNNAPDAISPNSFDQLRNVLDAQWFDDTRLTVALQALQDNWFTSAQIASIMDMFWFENSKLAFAKAAYPKVIDKQNYFIVNQEFWFSSSVEELNAFLSAY